MKKVMLFLCTTLVVSIAFITTFTSLMMASSEQVKTFASFSHAVAMASVPEPAILILLGSGLIGLAGFGRKKFEK